MEILSHLYLLFQTYSKPIAYYTVAVLLIGGWVGWKIGRYFRTRSLKKWLKKYLKEIEEKNKDKSITP